MTSLYRYTARQTDGRETRGRVEAASREEALARLHRRRLTPLSLQIAMEEGASSGRLSDRAARDLARTLAQLLRSGLSLAQALRFAGDEVRGPAAAAAVRLREATERGERPSSALEQFGGAPAKLLSGVILAGETSGRLAEALEVAATSFERSTTLRTRVSTALIYPAFVIAATLSTLMAFVFFVVPTMATAFEGSEAQLPSSTRDLLAISAWVRAHGLLAALGAGAAGFIAWSSPPVRRTLSVWLDALLYSPLGLGVAPRLEFAAFAGLAALSLDAGVPGAGAFEAAAAGVRGRRLAQRLGAVVLAIRVGERPSQAMARLSHPPRVMIRLMQVGEETGDLGSALRQAAELMAAEAEQRIQRLGAVIGPVITMALGGLVASVVLSLFLGLLSMSDLAVQ